MSLQLFQSPPCMAWDSKKTAKWDTQIQKYGSGRRKTLARQSYPEWELECGYTCLDNDAIDYVLGFFNKMKGSFQPFLWKDDKDYKQTGVQIGIGNGTTTDFQLVRNYGGYVEPVRDVAEGTLKIYQNGELLEDTTNTLANPSFETGDITAWNTWGTPTTKEVVSNSSTPCGNYVLHLVTSADNQGLYQAVTLISGNTYTLSAWVKVVSGQCVIMANNNTNYLSRSSLSAWKGDGNWHRLSLTFVAGSSNVIYIGKNADGVIGEYYFDAIQVEQKSYPTIFTIGIRSISNNNGLITISPAPSSGAVITASYEYYWRVTFADDELSSENFWYNYYKVKKVKLVSMR